jgi:hypothetical protein
MGRNDEMNKKVKFKINLFHLLDDLGGWEYFDQIVEDKMDNEYMSEGGYTLLSPLDKDELEWECVSTLKHKFIIHFIFYDLVKVFPST